MQYFVHSRFYEAHSYGLLFGCLAVWPLLQPWSCAYSWQLLSLHKINNQSSTATSGSHQETAIYQSNITIYQVSWKVYYYHHFEWLTQITHLCDIRLFMLSLTGLGRIIIILLCCTDESPVSFMRWIKHVNIISITQNTNMCQVFAAPHLLKQTWL